MKKQKKKTNELSRAGRRVDSYLSDPAIIGIALLFILLLFFNPVNQDLVESEEHMLNRESNLIGNFGTNQVIGILLLLGSFFALRFSSKLALIGFLTGIGFMINIGILPILGYVLITVGILLMTTGIGAKPGLVILIIGIIIAGGSLWGTISFLRNNWYYLVGGLVVIFLYTGYKEKQFKDSIKKAVNRPPQKAEHHSHYYVVRGDDKK